MSWTREAVFVVITLGVVLTIIAYNEDGIDRMAEESVTCYLRLYGTSIYEYHEKTGRWPTRIEDLAETSLPQQTEHWKGLLDDGVDVILWPKELKADPQDNANTILVYQNKGLDAERGFHWVCWGDMRTERISAEELQAHLKAGNR